MSLSDYKTPLQLMYLQPLDSLLLTTLQALIFRISNKIRVIAACQIMIVIRKEDDGRGGRPDNSSMKHIHITKTKRSKLQEKQPKRNSQPIPIPINQSPPSYKELEREATSHDSYLQLQYDMATWRMHNRITSARRLRADSLCYSSSASSNGNDEHYAAAARHKLMQYYCYQQLYLEVVVPRSSTGTEETTIHSLSTTDEDKTIDGQDKDKSIDDGVFMFEIA